MTDSRGITNVMTDSHGITNVMTDSPGITNVMTDSPGITNVMTDSHGITNVMTDSPEIRIETGEHSYAEKYARLLTLNTKTQSSIRGTSSNPAYQKKNMRTFNNAKCAELRYPCMYCTKRFRWPSPLEQHLRLHLNGIRWECVDCDRSYPTKTKLKDHYRKTGHEFTL